MKSLALIFAPLALSLSACADKGLAEVQKLRDENAELASRVDELEEKLETARTAANEVEGDSTDLGSAIASIDAESDGIGGYDVDTSDAELAHSSLDSDVDELQSALAE